MRVGDLKPILFWGAGVVVGLCLPWLSAILMDERQPAFGWPMLEPFPTWSLLSLSPHPHVTPTQAVDAFNRIANYPSDEFVHLYAEKFPRITQVGQSLISKGLVHLDHPSGCARDHSKPLEDFGHAQSDGKSGLTFLTLRVGKRLGTRALSIHTVPGTDHAVVQVRTEVATNQMKSMFFEALPECRTDFEAAMANRIEQWILYREQGVWEGLSPNIQ